MERICKGYETISPFAFPYGNTELVRRNQFVYSPEEEIKKERGKDS
jgi:hypothetical protein